MSNKMTLQTKLRAGHVTRWHIVRTLRQQSLAEHLWRTYQIVKYLYPTIVRQPESIEFFECCEYALHHDITEVLVGDIPTPTKRRIEGDDPMYLKRIDEDLDSDFSTMYRGAKGARTMYIVKLADLIDGCIFLAHEGHGPHAGDVQDRLERRLEQTVAAARAKFPGDNWHCALDLYQELVMGEGQGREQQIGQM